jgi:hypothetical protein
LARIICVCLLVCCIAACDRLPESYAPPPQRFPIETVNPYPDAMMVSMGDSNADRAIIKDIYGSSPGTPWRWTKQEPTVHVLVVSNKNLTYRVDYTIWDEGFTTTGPLRISFFLNGKLLATVHDLTPGNKHFEKKIAEQLLTVNTEATLAFRVDKLYVSPRDKAVFGVILTRLGLEQ